MKKNTKIIPVLLIFFIIFLGFAPRAVSQVGVYTFHGSAGDTKVLKVTTVNNASLTKLFGPNWTDVIELFGKGAYKLGARSKSVVIGVNLSAKYDLSLYGVGVQIVAEYNTSNWHWTTGAFNSTPDSTGDIVRSFYDPTNLTKFINNFYAFWPPHISHNVSIQNAGAYFAQLPTPVAQYLGAIVWEPQWENYANTVIHHAKAGDYIFGTTYKYNENCTEIWTWDTTFGAWIGYKILDNSSNVIYEFQIELPLLPMIPGFEVSLLLVSSSIGTIGLIFFILKRKK